MILCSNPRAQYLAHKASIDSAISRVLGEGRYILGKEVETLEAEFASYIGVAHGIGVGSGTEALHLALTACNIGQGDEVITVSHTAVATVAAIEMAGATPVFVDIEPDFYTLDPAKLRAAISSRTKAIIPVHLYGQSAELNSIMEIAKEFGIRIIEDCAQAHGAKYQGQRVGSFGDMACFSFYPTKNLGAIGDGGMVVTNDPALAERANLLRQYGWAERYVSQIAGWNSRLDELQAAILRVKLPHLDADNAARARLAEAYDAALSGLNFMTPKRSPEADHVFHLYVIRSTERDALQSFLKSRDIGALVHYPVPVHLQSAYRGRVRGGDDLPETERAAREVLSLPIYPELQQAELEKVINDVRSFSVTYQ
jgi:dTDP-4-amino-4,6-dideoxygalactose transaminase